jgi:peptide/nickel transport system permease protein
LVVAVIIFNFFLFRLPVFIQGIDPADLIIGGAYFETDVKARLREQWKIPSKDAGFNEWLDHFIAYLGNMLTWNFGKSYIYRKDVGQLVAEKLPNTVVLLGTASVLTIIIGVVLGTLAANKRGSRFDLGWITISLTFYSFPIFFLGMLFIMVFGSWLGWFPVSGGTHSPKCRLDPGCNAIEDFVDLLYHMFLPTLTLTLGGFGYYLILMRNNLIDVLTEDYITTARAKGLKEREVLFNHAFRNAVLPMVTVIALTFAFVISGAVLTETIFSWSGLGLFILEALLAQDWPSAQAIFYLIAITVVIANFIADLLYGVLDPRIKYT